MGSQCSKNSPDDVIGATASRPSPVPSAIDPTSVHGGVDLSSYLAACEIDPDVQGFDSALHNRTSRVINNFASGVDAHSIPFDSFGEVTSCLIDVNEEVVRIILDCKRDIWNNPELSDLVQEYFEYSKNIQDLFISLDRCLKGARDRQLVIQVALLQYEEESKQNGLNFDSVSDRFAKTLTELKNFKEAGDPFTKEFFDLFGSVAKQQALLFGKLERKKRKLDKKLERLRTYRKVSNIIFAAAFVGVIICSVVAAALAAPPVVAALAAAASAPMGGMGKWFNSLWKKYEDELKRQRGLVNSMHVASYVTIRELEGIRVLVDRLEVQIESLLNNVGLAVNGEGEAVSVVIEEVKNKISFFLDSIDNLGKQADKYSRDIRRARTVILQRIIRHSSID